MSWEARNRPEGCLTDLKLDAWFAGDLPGDERSALADHLSDCVRCRERRDALANEREAFLAQRPEPPVGTRPTRKKRSHAAWISAGLIAMGLIATATLLVVRPTAVPDDQPTHRKGGAQLGFFVERAGLAQPGVAGQVVHPGDRIRFSYSSDRAAYLAIYGRDASGTASVYYPAGADAARVPEGYGALLDSAVELDGVLGAEIVFALFCPDAFALEAPRAALAGRGSLEPQAACRVETLAWIKERAP
ncbi:MAG TPA: hypothetical protein VK509_20590 [Polyangiales bacterium]|nr:hypothetical protein [Polyangiales bacterium]